MAVIVPAFIPDPVWFRFLEPLASKTTPWLIAAMTSPRGRERLQLRWSKTDQFFFAAFRTTVRWI